REAQALAKISHPNVVSIYDVGRDDRGEVYIAMELVQGTTLSTWIRQEPRSWTEVLHLFVGLAGGLQAMHDLGIVHRDFKPGNVLINAKRRPLLIDFGLARPDGEANATQGTESNNLLNSRMTQSGALVGTPSYMSPEQFRDSAVGVASDQFSFCISLYEALYGESPFRGRSVRKRATSVLIGRIREPDHGDVPTELLEILRRGLRVEPGGRWSSMQEVARLLREVLHTHDPQLHDPAETRRRRSAIVATLGMLVTFVGGYYLMQALDIVAFNAGTLAVSDAVNALAYMTVTRRLRHLWGGRGSSSRLGRGLKRFATTVAVLFLAQSVTGLVAGRDPADTVLANLVGFAVLAFVLAPFLHQVTRVPGVIAATFTALALIWPEHALLCLDLTVLSSAAAVAMSAPRRRSLRWISSLAASRSRSESPDRAPDSTR
nr:serine/threonine protein kinase [Deltaproteobacteria bacterium]